MWGISWSNIVTNWGIEREGEHVTSEGRKSVNQGALVSFYKQRVRGRKKSSAQSLKTRFILTHKDGSQPRSSVMTGTASTVPCTRPAAAAAAAAETVQHAGATEEASVKTLLEAFHLQTNSVFSNSDPRVNVRQEAWIYSANSDHWWCATLWRMLLPKHLQNSV